MQRPWEVLGKYDADHVIDAFRELADMMSEGLARTVLTASNTRIPPTNVDPLVMLLVVYLRSFAWRRDDSASIADFRDEMFEFLDSVSDEDRVTLIVRKIPIQIDTSFLSDYYTPRLRDGRLDMKYVYILISELVRYPTDSYRRGLITESCGMLVVSLVYNDIVTYEEMVNFLDNLFRSVSLNDGPITSPVYLFGNTDEYGAHSIEDVSLFDPEILKLPIQYDDAGGYAVFVPKGYRSVTLFSYIMKMLLELVIRRRDSAIDDIERALNVWNDYVLRTASITIECMAIVSVERTRDLVARFSQYLTCEELFKITAVTEYVTAPGLLAEAVVIGSCNKRLADYDTTDMGGPAMIRLSYLKRTRRDNV